MPEDKYAQAILKLIELTQKGELKWRAGSHPTLLDAGNSASGSSPFIATYGGRHIRVSRRLSGLFPMAPSTDLSLIPTEAMVELVDDHGNSLFQFPVSQASHALHSTVKRQVAAVDAFIDSLLED